MGKSSNANYLLNLVLFKKTKTTRNNLESKHLCPASTFIFKILYPKETYFQKHMFLTGC